ncbi:MAG: protein phosphatase 2C domain-containing protein [Serpentinimonas sp.]|jgi:serine/threonine protein phosphatase PrpC|nr:protein phosphatase 2C domain-containing protein [Serpentinimonas sp.]
MTQGFRILAATGLDRGDREFQQDQLCLLPHERYKGCMLAVVADGMGGRSGGRKASDQVMLTARQLFARYDPQTDSPELFLKQIAVEAHMVIRLTAASAEQEPHSTIAAIVVHPDAHCYWLHSGDTRIYHFSGKDLVQRTLDHSYVQMLVERGELTEEQAQDDPRSNILVGCLGTERDPPLTLHHIEQVHAGDSLLLCSDGLWHYVSPEEMGLTLDLIEPRAACEFLVDKARTRAQGTGDNISVVVIKFLPLEAE